MSLKEMVKISVIIPIYSIEKYIIDCVSSVIAQSYKNLEIILVDDGSPDQSPEICDSLSKEDERIIVIHKKNGGLSDARNVGIRAATGDYVLFLDGDDFYDDKEAISKLVKRIEVTKPDVLNFSYKKFFEDTGNKVPYFKKRLSMPTNLTQKNQQLDYLTKHGLCIASAWNKMVRRKILGSNMEFQQGIFSEDIEWCARLMVYAKSMDFMCEDFYCYRQREGSITHTIDEKKLKDLSENIIACIHLSESSAIDEQVFIKYYAAYQYGTFFKVQTQCTTDGVGKCIKRLAPYKRILWFHNGNKKLILLCIMSELFGYENTCMLIRYVYRKKDE